MKCSVLLLIILCLFNIAFAIICNRMPSHTDMPKTPVDENYAILIQGNPQTYIHGEEYRISLEAYNGARFISFILALENENGETAENQEYGILEVTDYVETRYSSKCNNMIENTNTNAKTHIDVKWVSPTTPGMGCLYIRATVTQSRNVWYKDDGRLTRRICEEIVDDVESNSLSKDLNPCCACDEASYDIGFEGLWSRNIHPKEFPAQDFITRFSDIIGASHTSDYRFWDYGQLATEGMKEYAEHGSIRMLQEEFNQNFKQGQIRTIIRARGPAYPNINGLSSSTVRVDPEHHLLSLVSKIYPSPDWIVGVSGLELCLPNCTWLPEKIISLYPWDIGTDAGPSYLSPDQPQIPPDVIRRIKHDFPNDPRSPFFDESGEPMKAFAKLTVRRKRLYEHVCDNEESNNKDVPKECATLPFSAWSECSARCGQGTQYRKRVYKQPQLAKLYNCDSFMKNYLERPCFASNCNSFSSQFNENYQEDSSRDVNCQLTRWSEWSSCSKTCGEGKMMRRRSYVDPESEDKCQSQRLRKLVQYKKCVGRHCLNEIDDFTNNSDVDDPNDGEQEKINDFDVPDRNTWSNRNTEEPAEEPAEDTSNNEAIEPESMNNLNEDENKQEDNSQNNNNIYNRMSSKQRGNERFRVNQYNMETEGEDEEKNEAENNEEEEENRDHETDEINEQNQFENRRPWLNRKYNPNEPTYPQRNNKNRQSYEDRYQNRRPYQLYNPNVIQDNAEEDDEENQDEHNENESGGNEIADCCFKELLLYPCDDSSAVGNFWFFNYCESKCMLYTANKCDRNKNKFTTLEQCKVSCEDADASKMLWNKQRQDCSRGFLVRRFNNYGQYNDD